MLGSLSDVLGADVRVLSADDLRAHAERLKVPDLEGAGWGKLIDKLFGELVQPKLIQPTFVMTTPRSSVPSRSLIATTPTSPSASSSSWRVRKLPMPSRS